MGCAIGLQDVDGLKTSDYLRETARRHIEGEVGYVFLRNVLMGEQNLLKKRYEHIDWKVSPSQTQKKSEKSSEKILRLMSEQPTITTASLAQKIGISTRAVDKQIAKLKTLGRLQRIGADKGGHWEVISK